MWELRHNITAHDAAYVALAERLDAVLITCHARLATASGPTCTFDKITGLQRDLQPSQQPPRLTK